MLAGMSKQGDDSDILRRIDERARVDHPAAVPHGVRVWRIERGGTIIGWLRFDPMPDGEHITSTPWHVYYDAVDDDGRRVWCRSFATSTSACAWTVQHAGEMRRCARELGATCG